MNCPLGGLIGGIDEAGRGPLAGPVVSSCVIWDGLPCEKNGINDSKLLREREREALYLWIQERAYKVGIGIASHEEIERINILQASLLSMERAIADASALPDLILIDGKQRLESFPRCRSIIKGDRKCFFVASASIVAKVVRDRIMDEYHQRFPQYNFIKNKGYPTAEHRRAIERYGVCPIHRKTFRGVRENCGQR